MPPTTLPHGPAPTIRALGWITATDYPADAMARHEQGGTGFILSIDIRGEVTGCTVNASSGSPTLDRATCDLLRQRARFAPALDGEGKPVAGTYASRANWQLPLLGYAPHPPVPRNSYRWITAMDYPAAALKNKDMGVTGFTLDVDGEGRVSVCRVNLSSGSAVLDQTTCNLLKQRARFSPATDAAGKPVAGHYSARIRWEPPGTQPPIPPGVLSYSYVVDAGGLVTDCRLIEASGIHSDARGRFEDLRLCPSRLTTPYKDAQGQPARSKVTFTQSLVIEPAP